MNQCDCPNELDEARLEPVLAAESIRNRGLVILGMETGLRLSELIGLTVGDVWSGGAVVRLLRITRSRLKGGRGVQRRAVRGRTVPLNARAVAVIVEMLSGTRYPPSWPLFPSREGQGLPLTRRQALRVIRKIFLAAGCEPSWVWGGHSLRRRFVRRVWDRTRDINVTRAAVGHRWIATTQAYLGLAEEEAQAAILAIGAGPSSDGPDCNLPRRAG